MRLTARNERIELRLAEPNCGLLQTVSSGVVGAAVAPALISLVLLLLVRLAAVCCVAAAAAEREVWGH